MIGRIISRYRILEQIGAGGMGVVYRARDEQLERDVAIKVLSPGMLADAAARRRFRKEALALARVNFPSIATIHEFGSEGDLDFLVTEYIPGNHAQRQTKWHTTARERSRTTGYTNGPGPGGGTPTWNCASRPKAWQPANHSRWEAEDSRLWTCAVCSADQ